jgi:acetolactate synthase-1/2/3 large subunit
MITFLIDAFHTHTDIRVVSMHHEQGAGFAAEGFGRMSAAPGVALATSGPGATNLLTAIGSCFFDSTPTVFITGQVNRAELKGDRKIRQLGFQETDIVSMARPITKMAEMVTDPASLQVILDRAFRTAMSGRPGPVLIDIPMDVQRAEIAPKQISDKVQAQPQVSLAPFWKDMEEALRAAKRPLILAGGGIRSARAADPFRDFVKKLQIPVVHSLLGVDVLAGDDPYRAGLIGSYGNRWANIAIGESDFLLVLGSRLDVRQTGSDVSGFKANRRIFHVDCEEGEMNNRVTGCETLVCDLREFLSYAVERAQPRLSVDAWAQRINELRDTWPDFAEARQKRGINPNDLMRQLSRTANLAAAYVVDVGQHQQWAAQSLQLRAHQRFLTSGGMGAMGFALPAAIGSSFATGEQVVVVAGDGGFQLNIQEIQTVVRNNLPLKIIILDNGCHGMVRQFQEAYFSERYHSTMWGYSAPDFEKVALAYGMPSATISDAVNLGEGLSKCFADPKQPYLLVVKIDSSANAYPKLAFGRSISEMEPLVSPLEMEGT